MGSPCLYFYWSRVQNSNHLHTQFNLGYPKDTKFYLESKASFIDISSIASFKLFLIAWLREYCSFSDSSVVSLKSWPWPKYIQQGTFFKRKNHVLLSNFFLLQICSLSDCSQQIPEKKFGGSPCSFKRKGEFIQLLSLV